MATSVFFIHFTQIKFISQKIWDVAFVFGFDFLGCRLVVMLVWFYSKYFKEFDEPPSV